MELPPKFVERVLRDLGTAEGRALCGALDEALRAVNSDYDAKRRTTLERQRIVTVPRGYFLRWMRARGKNKVPRLVNDRRVADDVLALDGERITEQD